MSNNSIGIKGSDWKNPRNRVFRMHRAGLDWTLEITDDEYHVTLELGGETLEGDPFTPEVSFTDHLAMRALEDTQRLFVQLIERRRDLAASVKRLQAEIIFHLVFTGVLSYAVHLLYIQKQLSLYFVAGVVAFQLVSLIALGKQLRDTIKSGDWAKGRKVLRNEDEELSDWQEALDDLNALIDGEA